MIRATTFVVLAFLVLAAPALAKEAEPKSGVTDAQAKQAIDRFKREFATKDLDFQLDAVIKLGKVVHKKVGDELFRILRNKDPEIQLEAMKALARQTENRKSLERKIATYLDEKKFAPRLVATTVRTIGKLEMKRHEEALIDMINSNDDDVAISSIRVLGQWRSFKALRPILLLWEFYPDDGTWTTGSVTVDTGAAGDVDQRAAKAKWKAKYGGRAKRARPEVVKALRANVNVIIDIKDEAKWLKRPAELREWMSENKTMLRKYR